MLVKQILKSKTSDEIISVAPGDSVADAAKILSERRIGCVLVTADGGPPEGILSERDIVREIGRRGSECLEDRVERVMTAEPKTCGLDETADGLMQRMTDGRFRHMPVLDGGKLVGMVTIGDVVKARLSELAMEKEALQGMIMGH